MQLRIQRDPTKRERTADDQARELEKMSLRILEDCKQIPKGDRLELRRHIKDNCM